MNDSTASTLDPARLRALRARAHPLEPVVLVGDKGLTGAVLAEIERALGAHELIKIRTSGERAERVRMMGVICAATGAAAVQHIGRILVVYREKPPAAAAKRRPAAPRGKARAPAGRTGAQRKASGPRAPRPAAEPTGNGRRGSRTASPRRAPARPPGRRRTSR